MWASELLRSSSQYQSQKRAAPEHRAQRSEHGAQLVAAVNCRAYEFRIKPFVLQAKMSSTYSLQHGLFRSAKSWRKRIIATSCILFLFSSYASCMAINVPRLKDVLRSVLAKQNVPKAKHVLVRSFLAAVRCRSVIFRIIFNAYSISISSKQAGLKANSRN